MNISDLSSWLITIAISYLLGCLNPAYMLQKMRRIDIQNTGTKNLGASNTAMALGLKFGIAVALFDIAKSAAAVYLARYLFPDINYIAIAAGCAAVLGHIFPFWLKFKAGKGFACYIGMILAYEWRLFLLIATIAIIMAIVTDYIVFATISFTMISPVAIALYEPTHMAGLFPAAISIIVLYKHMENFRKIRNNEEPQMSAVIKRKLVQNSE